MRTVANIRARPDVPVSGALAAVILLIIMLGAAPLAGGIPHAVPAGILIKVGVDIIDWAFVRRSQARAPYRSNSGHAAVIMMTTVMLITVFVDLVTVVGVVAGSLILVQRMTSFKSPT